MTNRFSSTRVRCVAALVIAISAVAACGGDDSTDPTTTSAAPARVVTDFFGAEVEVPGGPLRIVATDPAVSNLLALGVTPVASAINLLSIPNFLVDQLEGVEDISSADSPFLNLERLAAIDPDLVLSVGIEGAEEICGQLRSVAPTYCHAYGWATMDDLRTNLTDVAAAIGMEARADELVAQLDTRIAELADRIEAAGLGDEPISVLRVSSGGYSVRVGTVESALMRELGIARPADQLDYEQFAFDISPENLTDVDGYGVYVYADTGAESVLEQLESNPLWNRLSAVQNDRVWVVDGGVWNGVSFPAANAILDDIEATLLAGT